MLLGQGKRAGDARKQASKQASRRAALSRLGSSKTSFHDEQGFFLYLKIALDFFFLDSGYSCGFVQFFRSVVKI